MKIKNPFNWALRFGTIPSEFSEAMTYEEQIIWLYSQIKELKEGDSNYNYDLLENKPSIDGVILQGNVTKTQLGIEQNYNILANKPSINSVALIGNKSLNELGIQGKLIAGSGIIISGNTISATGGGSGGTSNYNDLSNLPSILGHIIEGNKTPEELGCQRRLYKALNDDIIESKYYDMTNIQIGDIAPEPYTNMVSSVTTDCFVISKIKGMHFELYGIYELILTNVNGEVVDKYSTNLEALDGYVDVLTNGGYLIINFSKSEPPKIELDFTSTYIDEKFKQDNQIEFNYEEFLLNSDGTITGFPDYQLAFSKFFLLDYGVYLGSISPNILIFSAGEIVGFDYFEGVPTFYNSLKSVKYESGQWNIYGNENIEDTLTNSRSKIPSSYAVYQAIQNISPSGNLFYTELTASLDLGLDGSVTSDGTTLATGYYLTSYGVSIEGGITDLNMANCILYYDSHTATLMKAIRNSDYEVEYFYYYTNEWSKINRDVNSEIPASGHNNDIPTNLAVRNYIEDKLEAKITYGTTDLTAGTSTLNEGVVYFVYEA